MSDDVGQWSCICLINQAEVKRSTEAELVGIYDAMRQILWTEKFFPAQGFDNNGSKSESYASRKTWQKLQQ